MQDIVSWATPHSPSLKLLLLRKCRILAVAQIQEVIMSGGKKIIDKSRNNSFPVFHRTCLPTCIMLSSFIFHLCFISIFFCLLFPDCRKGTNRNPLDNNKPSPPSSRTLWLVRERGESGFIVEAHPQVSAQVSLSAAYLWRDFSVKGALVKSLFTASLTQLYSNTESQSEQFNL